MDYKDHKYRNSWKYIADYLKETTMDTNTSEALEGSIEKWEKIVKGEGKDEHEANCPLCNEFNEDLRCSGCVVSKHTGSGGCIATPFVNWNRHQKGEHGEAPYRCVHCPTCKTLAQQEVDFLISLREPEEEKIEPQAGDVWNLCGAYAYVYKKPGCKELGYTYSGGLVGEYKVKNFRKDFILAIRIFSLADYLKNKGK